MAKKQKIPTKIHAIGRRKTSVARIYLSEGTGVVTVNGIDVKDYFGSTTVYGAVALRPVDVLGVKQMFDAVVTLKGGGINGQADAMSLALARALCMHELKANPFAAQKEEADDESGEEGETNQLPWKAQLKANKLLTRNARIVERKKYGFRKARKKEQYSKR